MLKQQPKQVVSLALALQPALLQPVNRFFEHCLSENYFFLSTRLMEGHLKLSSATATNDRKR
jgi:hypothetical protein